MFRMAENEETLHKAFLDLRPGSDKHWKNVVAKVDGTSQDERAETFAAAIRAKSPEAEVYLDIAKGDFAHLVAEALESEDLSSPGVPQYLMDAIDAVAHLDAEVR